MQFTNVKQIAEWRLCVGCGACLNICPEDNIRLENIVEEGFRPLVRENNCQHCGFCVEACPGCGIEAFDMDSNGFDKESIIKWGPIREVWEGYAKDHEIRYTGSSGGIATALALYCIERTDICGVLHIGADNKNSYLNKTYLSTSRQELLSRTGSRYSPAAPCDSLWKIQSISGYCAFIGKPCDIAGLRRLQKKLPVLKDKVALTIGIFCAGTPSLMGTLELCKQKKIQPSEIKEIRYRGNGWPGETRIIPKSSDLKEIEISYRDSWGFLQKYRPYRCYLCPDTTGELADISCGDSWYREIKSQDAGYSLIISRTEKGDEVLEGAMESGYVNLERVSADVIELSQKNLLQKKREIWGRLVAMKAFGIPTPHYKGFSLLRNWLALNYTGKLRSILSTTKRIVQRKYTKPHAQK